MLGEFRAILAGLLTGSAGLGVMGAMLLCATGAVAGAAGLVMGGPESRPDRLVTITGTRSEDLVVEYSIDDAATWHPATIYVGDSVDDWRSTDAATWSKSALNGRMPAGGKVCLWNCFFDVPMPAAQSELRFRRAETGEVIQRQAVDLKGASDVVVIDQSRFAACAGGSLPVPWLLKREGLKQPGAESLTCSAVDPNAPAVTLKAGRRGWHRLYVGLEPYAAFRLHLSRDGTRYAVPEYLAPATGTFARVMQEFCVVEADMTGEDVCLSLGGARFWRDASVRYLKFVPMSDEEVAGHRAVRQMATSKGRPFAGYVEHATPLSYEPALTLREHLRNEMRLNRARGSTDVYVHVIRIGSKAWYDSDVVERAYPCAEMTDAGWRRMGERLKDGDAMAIALAEGHAVGLRVFPDVGMDIAYTNVPGVAERTPLQHADWFWHGTPSSRLLDYRRPEVRDYVLSIVTELMTKYDVDGINLDFARFAYNDLYDEHSLVETMRRIHEARRGVEARWGHPLIIATRIPSYMYEPDPGWDGPFDEFVGALKVWARNGWVDRVMVCTFGGPGRTGQTSLTRYKSAISGTRVELWGDLYGGGAFTGTTAKAWLDIARKWVGEGLDDGLFFYTTERPIEFEQINWRMRLIDFPEVRVTP